MAKRRNAPALFELLRASGTDGGTPGISAPPTTRPAPTPTPTTTANTGQTTDGSEHRPARAASVPASGEAEVTTTGNGSKLALSTPRFSEQRAAAPASGALSTRPAGSAAAVSTSTPSKITPSKPAALKPTTVPAPTKSVEAKPGSSTKAAPPSTGVPAPDAPPGSWKETIERVVQIEGSRVTLTMSTLAAGFSIGGLVIAAVLLWVFGHAAGRSALSEDRAEALSDDAGRAVLAEAPAGDDPAAVLGDPSDLPPLEVAEPSREPVLEPDPTARVPTTPMFTRETPTPDPEPEPEAVAEIEPTRPAEDAGPVDSRQAGLNYLALGQLSDAAEAERTVAYLNANAVPAIAVEGRDRAGNTQYRLFTLLGVPGQGFRSNPERLAHQQRVFELGERWISEERGQLDFSRASQVQWTKYNP